MFNQPFGHVAQPPGPPKDPFVLPLTQKKGYKGRKKGSFGGPGTFQKVLTLKIPFRHMACVYVCLGGYP